MCRWWWSSQARIDTALAERKAGVSAQFRRDFLPLHHISYFIQRRPKILTKIKSAGPISSGTGFVAKFDFRKFLLLLKHGEYN
jgi:hypothetical protein